MSVHSKAELIGREVHLALLDGLLGDVVAGRGRAILIEGEPGIGKSALVTAALSAPEASRCEVLRGFCDELGQCLPLSALLMALGVDLRSADPRRVDVARALTSPPDMDLLGVRMTSGDPMMAAVEQIIGFVHRLCASGPMVLAIEDLHWADEASLLLWRRLCQTTTQLPLLLVATCRLVPVRHELDELRGELHGSGGLLVALDGLSEPQVAKLAADRLGGTPGPKLSQQLAAAAGNPLYVRELVDSLIRSDTVHTVTGAVELVAHTPREADVSLAKAIAGRLDFLSPQTRNTLRTAALLGPDFSIPSLAAVVERSPAELVDVMDEAMTAGVVEADGPLLRFRHGLIRRSLIESASPAVLAALYQHAARALISARAPVERVATLLLPVLAQAEGWELAWIAESAGALAARAPEVAAQLLEHALERLSRDDPRHDEVQDQFLAVSFLLGRAEQSERTARDILASGGPERVGRAAWFLSSTLHRTGRSEEACTVLAETVVTPLWQARNAALRSTVLVSLVCHAEAQHVAQQAYANGQLLGDGLTLAYALQTQSLVRVLSNDFTGALVFTDEILSITEGNAELLDVRLRAMGNRSAMLHELDRFCESEATVRQALMLAEQSASIAPAALASLRVRVADLNFVLGRWDDALAELDGVEASCPRHWGAGLSADRRLHGFRALIAGHRDDWQTAAQHLEALGDPSSLDGRVANSPTALFAWALAAEHVGRPGQVVEVLARCLAPDAEARAVNPSKYLPLVVRSAQECGDSATLRLVARACTALEKGEQRATKQADRDWCTGLLAGEPAPILAAASYYRTVGRQLNLANALEDAAVLQAAGGDLTSARAAFAEALDVYASLGAVWDARRSAARLRPYGVRPGVRGARQRPKSGWQALTVTEGRVAELVGQGMSNPDIAGQLLLSRRTVETHVSHILTKLQVRSRREVAERAQV